MIKEYDQLTKAVITGDIISSSGFTAQERKLVFEQLKQIIAELSGLYGVHYSIYRGDSLQGQLDSPGQALRHALMIKSALKSIKFEEKQRTPRVDMRISIGVGEIQFIGDTVNESDGEAYQYSGRSLDMLKRKGGTITLTSSDEEKDRHWKVILALLDEIMEKWTVSSAELIYLFLKDDNEMTISKELGISQPAVNRRKKHAGWDAIKEMLHLYETNG
jgi:hypothetical protein